MNAQNLAGSDWLTGPSFLKTPPSTAEEEQEKFARNENDPEVRKETINLKTQTDRRHGLGAERFLRFSTLYSLQSAIENLVVDVKEFKLRKTKNQEKKESKSSSAYKTLLPRRPTAKERRRP